MRLIDADGLKGVKDSVLCSRDYAKGWNDCIAEARHAPTADAEPVRHGRWIVHDELGGYWECSVCHAEDNGQEGAMSYRRCPYCGSKMDLKEGEQ